MREIPVLFKHQVSGNTIDLSYRSWGILDTLTNKSSDALEGPNATFGGLHRSRPVQIVPLFVFVFDPSVLGPPPEITFKLGNLDHKSLTLIRSAL